MERDRWWLLIGAVVYLLALAAVAIFVSLVVGLIVRVIDA